MLSMTTEDALSTQINTARQLEACNKFVDALRIYAKILAQSPRHAEAHLGVGRCALLLGQFDRAYEHFTAVLIQEHSRTEALWGRANVLMQMGREEIAIREIQRVLELDSPQTSLHVDCAALLNDFGYIHEALDCLANFPENLRDDDYRIEWCFSTIATQSPSDLVDATLQDCLSRHPEDALLTLMLAARKIQSEDDETGRALLEKALQKEPELVYRANVMPCFQNILMEICRKIGID